MDITYFFNYSENQLFGRKKLRYLSNVIEPMVLMYQECFSTSLAFLPLFDPKQVLSLVFSYFLMITSLVSSLIFKVSGIYEICLFLDPDLSPRLWVPTLSLLSQYIPVELLFPHKPGSFPKKTISDSGVTIFPISRILY